MMDGCADLRVSYSIDQLCLEPIRNARLDLQLHLPGLSSTITSYYRALDRHGPSSKWRGFQERPHGIFVACALGRVSSVARRRLSKMKLTSGVDTRACFRYGFFP